MTVVMAILILNLVKKTLKLHILTAVVKRDMKMGQIQAHFVDLNGIVKASGIELGFHEKLCFFEDFRTKMKASGIRKFLRIFSAKMKASGIDFSCFSRKTAHLKRLSYATGNHEMQKSSGMPSLWTVENVFIENASKIVHISNVNNCSHL